MTATTTMEEAGRESAGECDGDKGGCGSHFHQLEDSWMTQVEPVLYPSLHPAMVMGGDVSHYCDSLMYGELSFATLAKAFTILHQRGSLPSPPPQGGGGGGGVFYDVGCGMGRTLFIGAWLHSWGKAVGLEVYEPRARLAQEALKRWEEVMTHHHQGGGPNSSSGSGGSSSSHAPTAATAIRVEHADVLECDLSDANVILLVCAAFTDDLMSHIEQSFQHIPVGTKAICITKPLPEGAGRWATLHTSQEEESWGRATLILQDKVK